MLQTVLDFIARVGEWVTPIILSILALYVSVKEIKAIVSKHSEKKRSETTINLLEKIVEKNDVEQHSKKIEHLEQEITSVKSTLENESSSLRTQASTLGEMLSLIFENSTLSNDVKERLRTLKTKVDCPSDNEAINRIVEQNAKLRDELKNAVHQVQELKEQTAVKINKKVGADTTKKSKGSTLIQ